MTKKTAVYELNSITLSGFFADFSLILILCHLRQDKLILASPSVMSVVAAASATFLARSIFKSIFRKLLSSASGAILSDASRGKVMVVRCTHYGQYGKENRVRGRQCNPCQDPCACHRPGLAVGLVELRVTLHRKSIES